MKVNCERYGAPSIWFPEGSHCALCRPNDPDGWCATCRRELKARHDAAKHNGRVVAQASCTQAGCAWAVVLRMDAEEASWGVDFIKRLAEAHYKGRHPNAGAVHYAVSDRTKGDER